MQLVFFRRTEILNYHDYYLKIVRKNNITPTHEIYDMDRSEVQEYLFKRMNQLWNKDEDKRLFKNYNNWQFRRFNFNFLLGAITPLGMHFTMFTDCLELFTNE